jgi:hypothetical protein
MMREAGAAHGQATPKHNAEINIQPTDCPFGEIRRGMFYCRHYKMSSMIDHDERPEYCRIEKITIEEEDENE